MTQEEKKKQIQAKYVEYQMIEQHMKQLQQQMQKMESQLSDIVTTHNSLEDMESLKMGSEILVPVSGGIFFRANLRGKEQFLVNVGSDVIVEKSAKDTKELVEKQLVEVMSFREKVAEQLSKLSEKGTRLEKELQELIE